VLQQLIVHRNISIALHQGPLYILLHQDGCGASGQDEGHRPFVIKHGSAWAQIRAMPDHRPKGPFHD